MAKTPKVIITPIFAQDFDGISNDCQSIGNAINDNEIFKDLDPAVAASLLIIIAFVVATQKAKKGSSTDRGERDALLIKVKKIMSAWCAGVNNLADGDLDILTKSKFPLGKIPSHYSTVAVPGSPDVKTANGAGKVKVRTLSVKGAGRYQFRYGTMDPSKAVDSDYTEVTPGGSKKVVEGLTPGTIYFFCARAIGAFNTSGWSEPTMFMANIS